MNSDIRLQDVKDELAQRFARSHARAFLQSLELLMIDIPLGSPIERLMAAALFFLQKDPEHYGNQDYENSISAAGKGPASLNPTDQPGIRVYCQAPIGKYRVDFLVGLTPVADQTVWGVIECDGHDFHERTKKQATHDKQRDRYLAGLGLIVLRYTGSEIYADPLRAASQALEILDGRTWSSSDRKLLEIYQQMLPPRGGEIVARIGKRAVRVYRDESGKPAVVPYRAGGR